MKMKELRQKSADELKDQLTQLRQELMKANAQIAVGSTPTNPGKVRALKRTIARIISRLEAASKN